MPIIEAKHLKKVYDPYGAYPKTAIKDLDLSIDKKEFVCIMGTSGSGKTTLINILSTIDNATNGEVIIDGNNVVVMSNNEKSKLRKSDIGFIFQNYNLIESLKIKDNILFSLRINHISKDIQNQRINALVKKLNIEEILNKYPSQCSGGQQQRAAIARALIMQPKIIFADEPTGNLDSRNGRELMELFKNINKENETTIVMVSHDCLMASYASKVYFMNDGQIEACIEKTNLTHEQYYSRIVSISSNLDLEVK